MNTGSEPLLDRSGHVLFRCGDCGAPISQADIHDLGMRLPEPGESADEYFDAELVNAFRHERCALAARAS